MKKTIFLVNLSKIFFEERSLRSDEKNFLMKFDQKMVFYIFEVNLDFNDFLIFKLNIIKKFELWQKLKCAQTLVLYSSHGYYIPNHARKHEDQIRLQ